MQKTSLLDKIVFSVAITVLLLVLVGEVARTNESFWEFLDAWQTLIAGGLALVGAISTVLVLRKQIKSHEDEFEHIQLKKALASRSTLPDALSRLCKYTEECIEFLTSSDSEAVIPEAPQDAIDKFKTAIEFIDDHSGKAFYEMVVDYQIYRSRLINRTRRELRNNFQDHAYDTIHFRCLLNRVFEYCRNEEETTPKYAISYTEVYTAYKNCLTPNQWDNPQFLQVIERMKEKFPLTEDEQSLIGNER